MKTIVRLPPSHTAPEEATCWSDGMPPKEMKTMPAMSARIESKPGGSISVVVTSHAAILLWPCVSSSS